MASRTWIAVILCTFVWFAYVQWFAPPPPKRTETVSPPPKDAASSNTPNKITSDMPADSTLFAEVPILTSTHSVNTGKQQIEFSKQGGKIAEVRLVGYRETIKKDSSFIRVISSEATPFSLGLVFDDSSLAFFGNAVFEQEVLPNGVSFLADQEIGSLKKEYKFNEGSYFIDAKYHLDLKKGGKNDWGYLIIPVGSTTIHYSAEEPLKSWEVVTYQNESIIRKSVEQIPQGQTVLQGNTAWLTFGNRYFSTVVVNQSELNPDVVLTRSSQFIGAFLRYPLKGSSGATKFTVSQRFFIGPKDYKALATVPGLRSLIDYGMFSFLAYPMLELLRFFYSFVRNYGIAIILLTLAVRVLFYPLSVKSARSMKAMQKLQPQIQALKERYKDDMQRFNQEQIALFRAHKVNPMGGCLPILVQIPVFIALYAVLANSIELFHAPFFGWIHDLSAKDPFYVFPVLMGLSWFLQQKMTPMVGMDPMQQKMMLFMPLVMTFFMINLPSGLTLYFFLSTLLGILQQWVINRDGAQTNRAAVSISPGGAKT